MTCGMEEADGSLRITVYMMVVGNEICVIIRGRKRIQMASHMLEDGTKAKDRPWNTKMAKWGQIYGFFWSNDEYNGRGCLRIGGCSYEGEWAHGKREGFFTETCGSYKCTGTWKNDVRHGIFENNDKTQQMYIWGVEVIYNSVEVKQATKRALSTGDYETASIIAEHYLNIISWAFLSTCDENGHLLYLVEPTQITQWLSKHSWNLFRRVVTNSYLK